jgi:phage terminase small subunit
MHRKTDDKIILQMLEEGHTQKDIAKHFDVSPAAICKRVTRLSAYPKTLKELTPKEQRFALSIAEGKTQTASAFDAYDVSSMDSAKVLGSQLMKKPKVNAAISEIMEYYGLGRFERIKKLKIHVDHRDPNISLKALDQSWKIDGSYRETHLHVGMTREEYEESLVTIKEEQAIQRENNKAIAKIEKEEAELKKLLEIAEAEERKKNKPSAKPKKKNDESLTAKIAFVY